MSKVEELALKLFNLSEDELNAESIKEAYNNLMKDNSNDETMVNAIELANETLLKYIHKSDVALDGKVLENSKQVLDDVKMKVEDLGSYISSIKETVAENENFLDRLNGELEKLELEKQRIEKAQEQRKVEKRIEELGIEKQKYDLEARKLYYEMNRGNMTSELTTELTDKYDQVNSKSKECQAEISRLKDALSNGEIPSFDDTNKDDLSSVVDNLNSIDYNQSIEDAIAKYEKELEEEQKVNSVEEAPQELVQEANESNSVEMDNPSLDVNSIFNQEDVAPIDDTNVSDIPPVEEEVNEEYIAPIVGDETVQDVEQPVEEAPVVEQPVVEEPTVEQPVVEQVPAPEPAVKTKKSLRSSLVQARRAFADKLVEGVVFLVGPSKHKPGRKPKSLFTTLKEKLGEKTKNIGVDRDEELRRITIDLSNGYTRLYNDYHKIEKLKGMINDLNGENEPQKQIYEDLISRLYHGKADKVEFMRTLTEMLDNYNDMYPNIRENLTTKIITALPSDIDEEVTQVENLNIDYTDEDVEEFNDVINYIKRVRGEQLDTEYAKKL